MKSPQAFRSIGEVARLVGVATHVLRYWETQFPALAPVRRPDGRRYYRPDDLLLAAGLCEVMREEGLTIRGAQRLIAMDKGASLRERGRLRIEVAAERKAAEAEIGGRKGSPRVRAQRPKGRMGGGTMGEGALVQDPAPPAMPRPSGQAEHGVDRSEVNGSAALAPPVHVGRGEAANGNRPAPVGTCEDAKRFRNSAAWLGRLTATAAALRVREHPLPAGARPLHDALRRMQGDRS